MKHSDKAFLNILANSFGVFLLLISSIIMVRLLSQEEYGTFLQVQLIVTTVTMVTFMGLPQSIFYFYPQASNKATFIKQTVILSLTFSGIGSLIIYFFMGNISQLLNNPDLIHYSVIIAFLILFQGVLYFRESMFFAQRALKVSFISSILTPLISYMPLFLGVYLGCRLPDLLKIIVCSTLLSVVLFILMLCHTTKIAATNEENDYDCGNVSIITQLKYAIPIGIASYIGIIGKEIDKYLISFFFSPGEFAIYSRGAMQIPLLSTIPFIINNIYMPDYVQFFKIGKISEFLNLMHSAIDKVAKINFPSFVYLFANSSLIIKLLYTEAYLNAVPIFRIYLSLLVIGVTVYGIIARASGKTLLLTKATLINVVTNIIGSLFLISYLGPIGAAIATIMSSIITVGYTLNVSKNILNVNFLDIMPWTKLRSIFLASLASSLPLWIVINFANFEDSLYITIYLFISFLVYFYVYLVSLSYFNLMSKSDWSFLRRWLRFDISKIVLNTKT